MSIERAQAIVAAKQEALTPDDVEKIELELLEATGDEGREAAQWVWESVAQIVGDPNYKGEAKMPK